MNDLGHQKIGFGLPYVNLDAYEYNRDRSHRLEKPKNNDETLKVEPIAMMIDEAIALHRSGIANVWPGGTNACGFGPMSEELRSKLLNFNIQFDPEKFESAEEVYEIWKKDVYEASKHSAEKEAEEL